MGLFSRKSATAVMDATWLPAADEPVVAAGDLTDDGGCASDDAYGVALTREGLPGASLTAWCYAVYGDEPGTYLVGYRLEHQLPRRRGSAWMEVTYTEEETVYGDLGSATVAAWSAAGILASRTGPTDEDPEFLDWDGAPW